MEQKENLQEKINNILRTRKIDADFFKGKTVEAILEEIGIYHHELESQNHELMRIRSELEVSQQHYFELFNEAPIGYVVVDDAHTIQSSNLAFQKMVGLGAIELKGKPLDFYIHPESQDAYYLHLMELLKNEQTASVQLYLGKNQWKIPVKIESNLVKANQPSSGTLIRCAVIDISVEKNVEDLLGAARDKADAANLAKSQFLANMSHEIRTPMNGILGFVQLLEMTNLDSKQEEYAQIIKKSADSLLAIVNDILDLSKIEAGKMELEMTAFNLGLMLASTVDPFRFLMLDKKLSFELDINQNIPTSIKGDQNRLHQILVNLLSNAVKFTESGTITLQVELVKEDETNLELLFLVKDSGIGIAKEALASIFLPFNQADNSMTRKYGGTGLGLSISKKLVELMGGNISVTSQLGTGSCFQFTAVFQKTAVPAILPVQESGTARKLLPLKVEKASIKKAGADIKILAVEDNPVNLLFLTKILDLKGLCYDVATNGLEAVSLCQENAYDLIFMDCQMPEMDGFAATRQIKADFAVSNSQAIIVALTGNAMDGDMEACLAAGMDDYLSKPVHVEQVLEIIDKYL